MKPLVSIIVPVYKVEDYLERCLDSLCRQSLKNIEILLIDDASPDNCGSICDSYVKKDNRIKVLHNTDNRGLSAARNIGISMASSDYIMFVDSDDWVTEDYCEEAYRCATIFNAELVMFDYQIVKGSKVVKSSYTSINEGKKTKEEAIDLLFSMVGVYAWNKIYHKRLFENVKFPEGYKYEDMGTTHKLVLKAKNIYYRKKILYYYFMREGSIINNRTIESMGVRLKMCMVRYNDLLDYGIELDKLSCQLIDDCLFYCIAVKGDVDDKNYAFCVDTLSKYKMPPKKLSLKRKLLLLLFNYLPNIFDLVCTMSGRRIS